MKALPRIFDASFVVAFLLVTLPCRACNVPVFRYALERWPPAPYEILIFHRGPFTGLHQEAVNLLQSAAAEQFANVTVASVDLSATVENSMQRLWQQQSNASLPWIAVRYPDSESDAPPAWAGPLEANDVKALIDSPARKEITQRLLKGDSSVWLLLESGHQAQDASIASRLSAELKKMESTLELPPPAPDDPPMRSVLPLRMAFSMLRISPQDPAEQGFIRMLLGGGKASAKPVGAVAFPIFGRGRMLAALPEKELTTKLIAEACSFMSGACSCEVKDLSPGRDLLLAANWNSIFSSPPAPTTEVPNLPVPVIAQGPIASPLQPSTALASVTPLTFAQAKPRFSRPALLSGVALAGILVAITAWMVMNSKDSKSR